MRSLQNKYIQTANRLLAGIFFLAIGVFFSFFYSYHAAFIEQTTLFRLTADQFAGFLSKPAFLSEYISGFLVQFFYFRYSYGIIIAGLLCLGWLILNLLVHRPRKIGISEGGNLNLNLNLITLLPFVFYAAMLTRIEYPLSSITGFLIAMLFSLFLQKIKNRKVFQLLFLLSIPVLYWLIGYEFVTFLIVTCFWGFGQKKLKLPVIAIAVILLVLTPLSLRSFFLLTFKQSIFYPVNPETVPIIWAISPSLSLLVVVLFFSLTSENIKLKFRSLFFTVSTYIIIVLTGIIALRSNAGFLREKLFSLDCHYQKGNYQKVIELEKRYNLRNNIGAYYRNLSLCQMDKLPDELMNYYQPFTKGLFIPVHYGKSYVDIIFSNEVFYLLGDVNAAQHSALLGMIFSPSSQSSRMIKRLAEINLVNGEYAVAEKYLHLLRKTLFHRKWASEKLRYINNNTFQHCMLLVQKRDEIPGSDILRGANEFEKSLRHLVMSNPKNIKAVNYLLCYSLLEKDIEQFYSDLNTYYIQLNRDKMLPKCYNEALLIYLAATRAPSDVVSDYKLNGSITRDFFNYTKEFEADKGKGQGLKEKYEKTYWFYFHFARNNPE